MNIATMRQADGYQVEALIREVIAALPVYNEEARRAEASAYTADALRRMTAADALSVLVAKEESRVVGFCINWLEGGLVWLAWYGVKRGDRRRGVGRALLAALDRAAKARGAHKIWCNTRTENIESKSALISHGYLPTCVLRNHWYGQDFILWEKAMGPDGGGRD